MSKVTTRDLFFGGLLILSVLLAIRDVNNLLASDQVEWVFVFTGVGLGIAFGMISFFTDSIESHPTVWVFTTLLIALLFVFLLLWKPDAHIGLPTMLILFSFAQLWTRARGLDN